MSHLSEISFEYFVWVARWGVTFPLGFLFALCSLGTWSILVGGLLSARRGQEKGFSLPLPFMGSLFGLAFYFAIPLPGWSRWWWLAFVLDPTWPLIGPAFLMSLFAKPAGPSGN